jgi:hypothetical protein
MSNALFLGTFADKVYLPHIKHMFGGVSTYVVIDQMTTLSELEMYCGQNNRNITMVVTTSAIILEKLLLKVSGYEPGTGSINNYAGSFFTHKTRAGTEINIVIVDPLAQLISVPYGKFICARYISKLIKPGDWREPTQFSFLVLDSPSKIQEAYDSLSQAYAISVDIETIKTNLAIRCIGFTGIFISDSGTISTRSYVLPLTGEFELLWMRKFCDLPAYKIFQNGRYDNAYLLRYHSPTRNWLGDTAHFMHSWYSELPKDLAFQNAFFLRKVVYWKDLAKTSDLYEYYRYNALDTWATANIWITQILTAPDWACHNYFLEFPLVFPCLLSELTGLVRDQEALIRARKECDDEIATIQSKLNRIVGGPINVNSPIQVKRLLKILTNVDWDSSKESELERAASKHPLNRIIVDKILTIRGLRKIKGTYLRTDDDIERKKDGTPYAGSHGSKDYKSIWLYSLHPGGTDTARLASGEHHFWCGANIQNVKTGRSVKQTIKSYTGFRIAEADLEQAESRDTAFIVGSEPLIAAVNGSKDFHSVNASSFFGVAYDSIYDDATRKTKNKPLRDLAKRVNHGANYCMGVNVLVETMGEENIWKAKALLKLPTGYSTKDVAEYLLNQFHKTYPELKRDYYASIIRTVTTTRLLPSTACHILSPLKTIRQYPGSMLESKQDWTRYCFGQPEKNKRDLNVYVAHCPQSLNARTLNEGFMRVFYELALPLAGKFLLHAQIHDSILFSFKEGYEWTMGRVKELMEIPVRITSVDGKIRQFVVPASIKAGKEGKGVIYWSDTE